jgi:hypothetical protein
MESTLTATEKLRAAAETEAINRFTDFAKGDSNLSELQFMTLVLMFRDTRGPITDGCSIAEVMESMYEPGA